MQRALLALTLSATIGVALLRGQTSSPLRFEVASIKPNTSGERASSPPFQAGGRFTAGNATLHHLIEQAYQVRDFQVVGGPHWATRERWDILARAPGNPPASLAATQAMRQMLQALLADRFGLRFHSEIRTHGVYELVLARKGGRLGPKLTRSAKPCGGPPPERPCGFQRVQIGGDARLESAPMTALASVLASFVEGIVVDRTGLTGNFDLDLTWSPELSTRFDADAPVGGVWSDKPSLYTALQEQLGLRLQPVQGPMNVLVIDGASRPLPD